MSITLTNYTILGSNDQKLIEISQTSLKNLEHLLNSRLRIVSSCENMIDELNEIVSNWSDLTSLVNSKYNGFWDQTILDEEGKHGTCLDDEAVFSSTTIR